MKQDRQTRPQLTGTPSVIAVTADDDRYADSRLAAADLAQREGAELILYDWDAAALLGDPLPSVWSADGTDTDVPDRLDEAALEAAGRHAMARQVEEAKASGLSASAWLPSVHGPEALVQYARDHGAVVLFVPQELHDLADRSAETASEDGARPLRVVVA